MTYTKMDLSDDLYKNGGQRLPAKMEVNDGRFIQFIYLF